MSCLPRLSQNQERKNATKRYCCTHQLHYFKTCPLCDIKQAILQLGIMEKQKEEIENNIERIVLGKEVKNDCKTSDTI